MAYGSGNYLNKYKIQSATPSTSYKPNSWINQLKKTLNKTPSKPKLPDPVKIDQYATKMTTVQDIEKKFGFDFSRKYAERQAGVKAQGKRDEIQTARDRAQYELERSKTDLEHGYFLKHREDRQEMADRGILGGVAAERELRTTMDHQRDLGRVLEEHQLIQQDLDRRLKTVSREEQLEAERIYNERLAQAFDMAMEHSRFRQSENQWRAQMAMQQRQQQVEEAWREFEFNNMSYAQRMQLLAEAEMFGMDMAWERYKFEQGLAFDAAYAGAAKNLPSLATRNVQVTPAAINAYNVATSMGLRLTSAYRDPAHNARVGGSKKSAHMQGRAYDFAGSKAQMDAFARWAKQSGLFKQVLWQVAGHYDHVHVSW